MSILADTNLWLQKQLCCRHYIAQTHK